MYWLKEWLYPDKCVVCHQILNESTAALVQYTCISCEGGTLAHTSTCKRCGSGYMEGASCEHCDEVSEKIQLVRGLFPYSEVYKASVLRWKFKGIRKYSKGYGKLMVTEIIKREGLEIDLLIPIPIAKNRYAKRGFNQSLDLAKVIGETIDLPVYDLFVKKATKKPQSACKKEERAKNIKKTISLKHKKFDVNNKVVAFIDDVYTTGSTVNECINVLEEASIYPKAIYVLTVCIGR